MGHPAFVPCSQANSATGNITSHFRKIETKNRGEHHARVIFVQEHTKSKQKRCQQQKLQQDQPRIPPPMPWFDGAYEGTS